MTIDVDPVAGNIAGDFGPVHVKPGILRSMGQRLAARRRRVSPEDEVVTQRGRQVRIKSPYHHSRAGLGPRVGGCFEVEIAECHVGSTLKTREFADKTAGLIRVLLDGC